ncbi:fluoride efflux transporter CrcB [Caldimonas tepidiphila]|uniref:fluoride efflux transporter CrcB n=1 Tax=Caldimonas tepidiphila TaxID=2315841 RepID=UPI000E5B8C71|nr:fluoride efflux transporter CrcB [Caldimonas tepidiphila]
MGTLALSQALAVALGAALGALLRWQAGLWLNGAWGALPLGTLLVNCAGGLLIGAALAWFGRHPDELLRLLLVTGFLGGLTTFSAFSAESLLMLQRQEWGAALAHALAHVLGALGAAALGHRLASAALA